MDEKRTHLIERAAARLGPLQAAETEVSNATALAGRPAVWPRIGAPPPPSPIKPEKPKAETERPTRQPISMSTLASAGLVCWEEPNDRIAEEFRIVETKILRQSFGNNGLAANDRGNIILVTSALKGEGKSFCSINLAGEVARQGDRKVLLIDIDPKPHGLTQKIGASEERGLVDLARTRVFDIRGNTIPTEADALEFLPFGATRDTDAELFATRRMAEVIQEIGRHYRERLIILDAPPCLSSSTPHTLAGVVGQVVLVVAAGHTQETDVEAALELVRVCPHISLLLNKVPVWMTHSYGAYGRIEP